jgi:hypothetical protein
VNLEDNLKDPYVIAPTLTADGKPWIQRCYICLKPVDFLKMLSSVEYVRAGKYVRHKKCYPS